MSLAFTATAAYMRILNEGVGLWITNMGPVAKLNIG